MELLAFRTAVRLLELNSASESCEQHSSYSAQTAPRTEPLFASDTAPNP
eukprot:COSAG01_NODE_57886_length_309_cov_1.157143_1_plen_48_part_10